MTTEIFQRPESVPCWAEVRDWAKTLIDPSEGVKITIRKPDGTVAVDNQAMSKISTGKYVYYYDSKPKGDPPVDDPTGWWSYSCTAVDGSGVQAKTTITHGSFRLD